MADELGHIAGRMDESASVGETVGVSFEAENVARADVAAISRKIVKLDRSGFIFRKELASTVIGRLRNLHNDIKPPVSRLEPRGGADEFGGRVDCGGGEE